MIKLDRKHLERCFQQHQCTKFNVHDMLWALIDNDMEAIAEFRAERANQQGVYDSYFKAYDLAKDDFERAAVIGCVRMEEPLDANKYASKVADLKLKHSVESLREIESLREVADLKIEKVVQAPVKKKGKN